MPRSRPLSRHAALVTLVIVLASALLLISRVPQHAQAQGGRATSTPLPLYALPDARTNRAYSSGSLALAPDAITLVAANAFSNSVTVLVPTQNRVVAEIPVGRDPRGIAITPDGRLALAANRAEGSVSVIDLRARTVIATIEVGVWPYGVVSGDNAVAYVSLQGSGEIAELDLVNFSVRRRFTVPDVPSGLALWGDYLYVTHFWTGEISLVYLPRGQVIDRVNTGGSNGLSQAIVLDITRGIAYLPQTLSNPLSPALTYDSAVLPVVNIVNLRDLRTFTRQRIAIDQVDQAISMPFDAALDRFQQRLYVVNAGSDSLSVINLNDGRLRQHLPVGANPRGVLLNQDASLLFVHNFYDATITSIQTSSLRVVDVQPISTISIPGDLLIGGQLFYSATDPRVSREGWLSCAACHFDGMSDGRVWRTFSEQPRNTPTLFGLGQTAPYRWSGDWDELADIELRIRGFLGGAGLIADLSVPHPALGPLHTGLSADLDALTSYLLSLGGPISPYAERLDAALIGRGEQVFADQNCASCHAPPAFTSNQPIDVGGGMLIDTPQLRWLWLSAPYFHDGRAATLHDVFALPGLHELVGRVPREDIDALIAYLLSLPQS